MTHFVTSVQGQALWLAQLLVPHGPSSPCQGRRHPLQPLYLHLEAPGRAMGLCRGAQEVFPLPGCPPSPGGCCSPGAVPKESHRQPSVLFVPWGALPGTWAPKVT